MKKPFNPFHLRGYHGAALFCDRSEETEYLISNIKNNVNTTIISFRRMGKSGLIHHAFEQINKNNNYKAIYVDVYATQNLSDFTNEIASAILQVFPIKKTIGEKFLQILKSFSPVLTYDDFSGVPTVSLSHNNIAQQEQTLKTLFTFLEQQNQTIVVAIDEFQQIANFPEKNIEHLLRTLIQPLKNTIFIFSGSQPHILIEMFSSTKRPFFSSTQILSLGAIDGLEYAKYIKKIFKRHKRTIDKESIAFILNWTKRHTYYTQALCNKIFAHNVMEITIKDVYYAADRLLKEHENIFFQYRNLLTRPQWNLLKAIAKEGKVNKPTSQHFIMNHKLGNASTVKRSLLSLFEKEMIFIENLPNEKYYVVYDCFLSRWMERLM